MFVCFVYFVAVEEFWRDEFLVFRSFFLEWAEIVCERYVESDFFFHLTYRSFVGIFVEFYVSSHAEPYLILIMLSEEYCVFVNDKNFYGKVNFFVDVAHVWGVILYTTSLVRW